MKRLLLLLLLFPITVLGQEAAPEDPLAGLPGALRPGAKATFTQGATDDRLKGRLSFAVTKGAEAGTVVVAADFATADQGPLTFRSRLKAVLDAKARRIVSFTCEVGGKDPESLRVTARLLPDPDREGKWIHERIRYDSRGEPKVKKTRLTITEGTTLDLLEPFTAGLVSFSEDGTGSLRMLTVETGRLLSKPVGYRALGEGEMEISGETIPCRILMRTSGEREETVYLRTSDLMPVRYGSTRLEQ